VFAPGIQGAHSELGHVAYLEQVKGGGTFHISEKGWISSPCQVHYRDAQNGTGVEFIYAKDSLPSCPTGQYLAKYYPNAGLKGHPVYLRCEKTIDKNWGTGGPGHGIPGDNFSVRWTGTFKFGSGDHTFIARSDDGVRVWLDGNKIIGGWRDQPATTYRAKRMLASGKHKIRVDYYERTGAAVAKLRWERSKFNLMSKHTGKVVGVAGASKANGANVVQQRYDGGGKQKWRFIPAGGGYYRIVASHSGKCLDVSEWSQANGANVIQWECHGGDNQKWRLVKIGDAFQLVNKHSGKCLDVDGWSMANGANIHQWECHGGNNQLWKRILR
jgi:hypothetical protein